MSHIGLTTSIFLVFMWSVPACHPNSVNDLHVHGSPCVTQKYVSYFFQSGIVVNEIMCGDEVWHIDYCPPNFIMQCSALQKNIDVKCTWNINTYKTTFGTPIPCYSGLWAQFQFGSLEHHKHWFYLDDFNRCVGGFPWKYIIARSHVSIVWLVQHGVNFT
jgi:hypothetical protein